MPQKSQKKDGLRSLHRLVFSTSVAAQGGVFDGILHGWVFNPGPGMRWDTYGKIVAMLEEKFEAVQRDRMRSFIEPPKPIPVKLTHDC